MLLKVYQKIDAFRGDAALSSWIYRITFNAAMSRLREFKQNLPNAMEKTSDEESGQPLKREVVDWAPLADEDMLRGEMRQALVRALKDMPVLYRAPVILRDVQGLSTEEASAVLHVKEQTLKSRLHRGRLMLREQLADFSTAVLIAALRTERVAEKDDGHRSHSHEAFVEGSWRIGGAHVFLVLLAQRDDRVLAEVVGNRLRRPLRVAVDRAVGRVARRARIRVRSWPHAPG